MSKKAKQKYLYHASAQNNLRTIKPRSETIPSGFDKGSVVFATDCFTFSTQFIVPHDDSWANGGAFGDISFFVISDRERFEKADKGGTIYLVPSDTFKKYNRKEWFSRASIKSVGKVHFSSGLQAMIIRGVQVYFVDKKTYKAIQKAKDHGLSILNNLESENERWGREIERLQMYKSSKKKILQ